MQVEGSRVSCDSMDNCEFLLLGYPSIMDLCAEEWREVFENVKLDTFHSLPINKVNILMKTDLTKMSISQLKNACSLEVEGLQWNIFNSIYCAKDKLQWPTQTLVKVASEIASLIEESEEQEQEDTGALLPIEEEPVPKKKKTVIASYPSLGKSSLTTMAKKELPRSFLCLPLYGHWFAMDIYEQYLSAREQIQNGAEEIKIWKYSFKRSLVNTVSCGILNASWLYQRKGVAKNVPGRGVNSSADIRLSELTYTAQFAHFINALTFLDPSMGAIFHQMPTRKQKWKQGNPECASSYAVGFVNGHLLDPVGSSDTKLLDFEHAERTTIYNSVNLVSVNHDYHSWPIIIGYPNTPAKLSIQVHIPVDGAMWFVPVVDGTPSDHALLCTLSGCIRQLSHSAVSTKDPLTHMMPKDKLQALKPDPDCRVFLDSSCEPQRVYKYYDRGTDVDAALSPNFEYIQKCSTLSNVCLDDVTTDGKVYCLSYDYIKGGHVPRKPAQFVGILETINKLHAKDVVHGDVRACNIIFTDTTSHLLDFDLAKPENSIYPLYYNRLSEERHPQANKLTPMMKIHDRYALSIIMRKASVGVPEDTLHKIENIDVSLDSVINLLRR